MRSIMKRVALIGGVVVGALLFSVLGYYAASVGSMDSMSTMTASYQKEQAALTGAPVPGVDMPGSAGGAVEDAAMPVEQEMSAESRSTDAVISPEAMIITVASLELRVDDADETVEEVRRAARAAGAEISNLTVSAGAVYYDQEYGAMREAAPGSAVITLRVSPDALGALEKTVSGFGEVISQSANSDDVTEQAIDIEARLKNLRAEEATLRSFLDRTAKISELLEVERELARVRGEIESMDAQLTYLKRQSARATLTITLIEPDPITPSGGVTWDLRQAFARGIAITAGMLTALVTLAVPIATLGVVVALIVWPVRWLIVRRRRRHAVAAVESPTTEE